MLEIIVLMYNLVPYSRSALFLRRLQPDPLLETRPHQGADRAPGERGSATALPRGVQSGTALVPHCALYSCSQCGPTPDQWLQQGHGEGKNPVRGAGTPSLSGPRKLAQDHARQRMWIAFLAVLLSQKQNTAGRAGEQHQQGTAAEWALHGGNSLLHGGRHCQGGGDCSSSAPRSQSPLEGQNMCVTPHSSAPEPVVPPKTSHSTQLRWGEVHALLPWPLLGPSRARGRACSGWYAHAGCAAHAVETARCSHRGPRWGPRHGQCREQLGFAPGFAAGLLHRCCLPWSGRSSCMGSSVLLLRAGSPQAASAAQQAAGSSSRGNHAGGKGSDRCNACARGTRGGGTTCSPTAPQQGCSLCQAVISPLIERWFRCQELRAVFPQHRDRRSGFWHKRRHLSALEKGR